MADKIQMPQSGGGLIRYFDEYKSKIEFSPTVVVVMIVVVIVAMAILHSIKPLV
jgi:preprotein translocase subunit Sec61beta